MANESEKGKDWLCHSCGVNVSSTSKKCHMCGSARPGDTDWICNICTFVNEENEEVCQMCLGEKPRDIGKMNSISNGDMNNKTWPCPACDYHNARTKLCRMCGYELGNKVTRQNGHNSKDNGVELAQENVQNDKPAVEVGSAAASAENLQKYSDPKSPSKHVDGNSLDDVFADIGGWDQDPKSPPDGI